MNKLNRVAGSYRIVTDITGLRAVAVTTKRFLTITEQRQFTIHGFLCAGPREFRKLIIPSSSRRDSIAYATEFLSEYGIGAEPQTAVENPRMADEESARYSRIIESNLRFASAY